MAQADSKDEYRNQNTMNSLRSGGNLASDEDGGEPKKSQKQTVNLINESKLFNSKRF